MMVVKCIDITSFLISHNRFDIHGLSPDAVEDESGIKRASENSGSIYVQIFVPHPGSHGTDW